MKYPIGIQSFDKIRTEKFSYVDKTEMIFSIASVGGYYFLSRPRRFGKSLLLSTFESYFKGKRELFEGLAINGLEKDWTEYPVLRLDLNSENYNNEAALKSILDEHLRKWEKELGIAPVEQTLSSRFRAVIQNACEKTGRKVVILVDEYDKPLLQTIDKPELQESYRATLKAFYGNLKSCDEFIRFAFLIGVTKFGKISVFSDLNNLKDISLDNRYCTLCGITEAELHSNFEEGMARLATENDLSMEECYAKMKKEYDGYHFSIKSVGVYNPFSVLNALDSSQFGKYWFETGTPDFLVKKLQNIDYRLENLTRDEVTTDRLSSLDVSDKDPLPLFYQSGYLTIKKYDKEFDIYTLGFPNREVELGFTYFLSVYYVPRDKGSSTFSVRAFVREIFSGNAEGFMTRLASLLADGNYQVVGDCEIYFQNTLYVFFKLLGFYVDVERHTSDGRMDMVMQTKDYVYIIEFKMDQTAEIALQQIEEKGYAAPFAADTRRIFKIGINFNTSRRCIDDWKIV